MALPAEPMPGALLRHQSRNQLGKAIAAKFRAHGADLVVASRKADVSTPVEGIEGSEPGAR